MIERSINCHTCLHSGKACDDYPCRSCGVERGNGPFDRWKPKPAQPDVKPGEPALYVSQLQLANHIHRTLDPDDDSGRYLPVRNTPAGNFTMPLFAAPPAQPEVKPRLTDEMLRDCLRDCPREAIEPLRTRWLYAKDFARAIESAVRKQFGVNDE